MTDSCLTLPLELPEPRRCWYCGDAAAAVYEREHQVPVSRGGAGQGTVDACRGCNRLKGDRTVAQFRFALATQLGLAPEALVFAGEAPEPGRGTDISSVRSLADERDSVRLYPQAGEALRRAHTMFRAQGDARASLTALASGYVHRGALRDLEASRQERLFDLDEPAEHGEPALAPPIGPAKVTLRRRVVKIDAQLHEALVAAVLFARTQGRPHLLLVDALDEAAAAFVQRVQDQLNGGRPLPPVSAYADADLSALQGAERR